MAPLPIRLAAGAYAVVTADEVRDLLGWSRERADALLGRVPAIRGSSRGRVLWRWGRVLDVAESEEVVAETRAPPPAVEIATDVKPRKPAGRVRR